MSPNQSRIAATFAKLNAEGRKALIPFEYRAEIERRIKSEDN